MTLLSFFFWSWDAPPTLVRRSFVPKGFRLKKKPLQPPRHRRIGRIGPWHLKMGYPLLSNRDVSCHWQVALTNFEFATNDRSQNPAPVHRCVSHPWFCNILIVTGFHRFQLFWPFSNIIDPSFERTGAFSDIKLVHDLRRKSVSSYTFRIYSTTTKNAWNKGLF